MTQHVCFHLDVNYHKKLEDTDSNLLATDDRLHFSVEGTASASIPSPVLSSVFLSDASDDSDVEVVKIETRSVWKSFCKGFFPML